ncbi:ABC-type multidrug transport system permease subunit [Peptoniphilus olsenii]|uniref:ABC-type multidrug transport system permease subunit n=1 Tax=Peptoniphilus olsenii TaxID=411570 RepID=A0ABV2J9F4_9FIRM
MENKTDITGKIISVVIMIVVCYLAQFFIEGYELIILMIILATVILKNKRIYLEASL